MPTFCRTNSASARKKSPDFVRLHANQGCCLKGNFSLEGGFEMVTPTTCQAAIEDMRREEDRYWHEDMDDDEADE